MSGRATLPIFPLNLVLFPGGVLPLKIFEQRYLEMTKECLRDNVPFGVCLIREGQEVGTPAAHEAVGCTASIAEWEMPHLGLFQLRTIGQRTFRIVDRTVRNDGLIEAEIEWLADVAGTVDEETFGLCRRILESIAVRVGSGVFAEPAKFDDARWVSYRLAELLPVDLGHKQSLLEIRNDAQRLSRLAEMLKTD
jgi:Lon protease-like protein